MGSTSDSIWQREVFFIGGDHYLYDVESTSDGGYIATGYAPQYFVGAPHPGMNTIIVVKLDSAGCLVPGCQFLGLSGIVVGTEGALLVYPNPAQGACTLELALPSALEVQGPLQLHVFDVQGRLVVHRALGSARDQRIELDLSREPAGLYSAHLSDGVRILTGTRICIE